MIEVKFQKLHAAAQLPKIWTAGSVGFDIHACLIGESGREITAIVPPRTTRNIPTALRIEPPDHHFLMVCSRSGLASKSIFVANAPGIIDTDYRGEIYVLLYNGSHETYYVKHGDRVAQMLVVEIVPTAVVEVQEVSDTERGGSGFGSTGR